MRILKEMCVENYEGALIASQKGADRIELCDNLAVGGTTPSFATIERCHTCFEMPQAVIIRARGGNFVYSHVEKEIMYRDLELCTKIGVSGVVVGALQGDQLDKEFMMRCRDLASNCEAVCHMAFDSTSNLEESLQLLIELGYDRVLTKGGSGTAYQNLDVLKQLITLAEEKITILIGGGVTKDNVDEIASYTGAVELHGKKIV